MCNPPHNLQHIHRVPSKYARVPVCVFKCMCTCNSIAFAYALAFLRNPLPPEKLPHHAPSQPDSVHTITSFSSFPSSCSCPRPWRAFLGVRARGFPGSIPPQVEAVGRQNSSCHSTARDHKGLVTVCVIVLRGKSTERVTLAIAGQQASW